MVRLASVINLLALRRQAVTSRESHCRSNRKILRARKFRPARRGAVNDRLGIDNIGRDFFGGQESLLLVTEPHHLDRKGTKIGVVLDLHRYLQLGMRLFLRDRHDGMFDEWSRMRAFLVRDDFVNPHFIDDHGCPVKSRIESSGFGSLVNRLES
jgi:hypothetical protein